MHRIGIKRLRRAFRWIRCRLSSGGVVFGYHRVAAGGADPWRLCVREEHFADQMAVLRDSFQPASLEEVGRHGGKGAAGRPLAAVTFDDAYLDVLEGGLPILERFEIPATVFVVTESLGQPYWWDQLEALLHAAEPGRVRLDLSEHALGSGWANIDASGTVPETLHRGLRAAPPLRREAFLAGLAERFQVPRERWVTPGPRAVTGSELRRLASHPFITIGAHTRTHLDLKQASAEAAAAEVAGSRASLEELLGEPVTVFAYPHGETSAEARAIVADTGFRFACAGFPGRVDGGADPLLLPRLWPPDGDGVAFRRFLRRWTGR